MPAVKEEYEWILENPNFDIEEFLGIKNRRELEAKISHDFLDLKLKNRAKSYIKDQIRRARGGEVVELTNIIRSTKAIGVIKNRTSSRERKTRNSKVTHGSLGVTPRLKGSLLENPTKSPAFAGRSSKRINSCATGVKKHLSLGTTVNTVLANSRGNSRTDLTTPVKTCSISYPPRPDFLNESDENSSKGLNTPKNPLPIKSPRKYNVPQNGKTPGTSPAKNESRFSENLPRDQQQNLQVMVTSIHELPENPTADLDLDNNEDPNFYNPSWNKSRTKITRKRQRSTLLDIWEKKEASRSGVSHYFNKTKMTNYLTEYMIGKKQKEKESLIEAEKSKEKQRTDNSSSKWISKIKSIAATPKKRGGADLMGGRGAK